MDSIIVKVSALLVMVQAIANAEMDYVALSTEAIPNEAAGYLHFEAYPKQDLFMGLALGPAIPAQPNDMPLLQWFSFLTSPNPHAQKQ